MKYPGRPAEAINTIQLVGNESLTYIVRTIGESLS